jgi:Protein kinase domain
MLERLKRALDGRYRLDREVGSGGMAVVYLAEDLKHGRRVALKVLRPEVGHELGGDRFLREIRTAARLSHPNILPLFDPGDADGLLYKDPDERWSTAAELATGLGEAITARAMAEEWQSALEWIEAAVEVRDANLPVVGCLPTFWPLHDDPRFRAIVEERMGLPLLHGQRG